MYSTAIPAHSEPFPFSSFCFVALYIASARVIITGRVPGIGHLVKAGQLRERWMRFLKGWGLLCLQSAWHEEGVVGLLLYLCYMWFS